MKEMGVMLAAYILLASWHIPAYAQPVQPSAKVTYVSTETGGFKAYELLSFTPETQRSETEKSKIRQEYKEVLNRLIERNPRDPKMPDYLFLLGEVSWAEAQLDYLIRRLEWPKAVQAWDRSQIGPKPPEPVEDYGPAIGYYDTILSRYPDHPRREEVLFRLGRANLQHGRSLVDMAQAERGYKYLEQLVQTYPNSKHIAETHLAMADHFLRANDTTKAKLHYARFRQTSTHSLMVAYAAYKLAWTAYHEGDFEQATALFRDAVRAVGVNKLAAAVELRDAALRESAWPFARMGTGWQTAKDYFKSVEGEGKMWTRMLEMSMICGADGGLRKLSNVTEVFKPTTSDNSRAVQCGGWSAAEQEELIGRFPESVHANGLRRQLALRYAQGDGVGKDLARAASLYREALDKYQVACEVGILDACWNLGRMRASGEQVPVDVQGAAELIDKACGYGDLTACLAVGTLYAEGTQCGKDVPRALRRFKTVCERQNRLKGDEATIAAVACVALDETQANAEREAAAAAAAAAAQEEARLRAEREKQERASANAAAKAAAAARERADKEKADCISKCRAKGQSQTICNAACK